MDSARIKLYGTRWCGYCIAARRLLSRLGLAYDDIDVSDRARRAEIIAQTGWRTVPVILIDGALVGGFSELSQLHRRGGLEALLSA